MEKVLQENLKQKQREAHMYAMIYCVLGFFLISFSIAKIFLQNDTNILGFIYLGAGIVFLAIFYNYRKKDKKLSNELKELGK